MLPSSNIIRRSEDEPVSHEAHAPICDELTSLLNKTIARLMQIHARVRYLVEEQGITYFANIETDTLSAALQAAACTYRIAFGLRAGQKMPSLRTARNGLCRDCADTSFASAASSPSRVARVAAN